MHTAFIAGGNWGYLATWNLAKPWRRRTMEYYSAQSYTWLYFRLLEEKNCLLAETTIFGFSIAQICDLKTKQWSSNHFSPRPCFRWRAGLHNSVHRHHAKGFDIFQHESNKKKSIFIHLNREMMFFKPHHIRPSPPMYLFYFRVTFGPIFQLDSFPTFCQTLMRANDDGSWKTVTKFLLWSPFMMTNVSKYSL